MSARVRSGRPVPQPAHTATRTATRTAARRTRSGAKAAGTAFETVVARYLAFALGDDRIERRARSGGKDRGDISGVRRSSGQGFGRSTRVVVECKNTSRIQLAGWIAEASLEAGNDDALVGVVVHKRHGNAKPADQWVSMTLADLVALLSGERPPQDVADLTTAIAAQRAAQAPVVAENGASPDDGGSGALRPVQAALWPCDGVS
jgi:hypothetical protein